MHCYSLLYKDGLRVHTHRRRADVMDLFCTETLQGKFPPRWAFKPCIFWP